MKTEIEAKWLNIDPSDMRQRLENAGATCAQSERLMKRVIFDSADDSFKARNAWVRVRDEDDKITLTYKQLNENSLNGMKEIDLVVDDFAAACSMLKAVGLVEKGHQETRRESWKLDNAQVEIDWWPWIPPLLEIEADSENDLKSVAEKLGLNYEQAHYGGIEPAYQALYNVSAEEILATPTIMFSASAPWPRKSEKA